MNCAANWLCAALCVVGPVRPPLRVTGAALADSHLASYAEASTRHRRAFDDAIGRNSPAGSAAILVMNVLSTLMSEDRPLC